MGRLISVVRRSFYIPGMNGTSHAAKVNIVSKHSTVFILTSLFSIKIIVLTIQSKLNFEASFFESMIEICVYSSFFGCF